MSQSVTVELSEEAFAALRRQAEASGVTPAERLRHDAEQLYRPDNGTGGRTGQPTADQLRAVIERHFPGTLGPPDARSEAEKQAARERLWRHFGAVKSRRPGADNEQIDADLAQEYADNHEDG
jgi:hypothetical protein